MKLSQLIIPLLILSTLLTGCAVPPCNEPGRTSYICKAPQETQQNVTTGAKIKNTQSEPLRNTPAYSATPDNAGTLAVLSFSETKQAAADIKLMADRTETQQVYNDNAVVLTQTAAPIAARATLEYQRTQNAITSMFATSRADYATQTADAPRDQATAAALVARAKYADLEAAASPVAMILMPLAFISLCAVLVYGLRRPHVSYNVAPRPDFSHAQGNTAVWTARECPPGIDTEQMIVIAHGRQSARNKNGSPLTRRNWLHVLTRAQWDGLIDYMIEHDYAVQAAQNSGVTVTPEGDEYLYQFEQLTPLPRPDAPPIVGSTAENPRGQGKNVNGEVV